MNNERIGVVGLGLLGRGIAACFLAHGFRVVALTKGGEEAYGAARAYIANALTEYVAHTGADAGVAASWKDRYHEAAGFADFADCAFVVESVTEDLAAKQDVFDGLEAVVGEEVPIASNTSALPIGVLQKSRRNPRRFVGMHWAEPAHATRFLELIRGEQTSDTAVERTAELGRRLDKDPCVVQKDVPGFIVNRLGYAMYREALHLVEAGVADVETVDKAFRNACGLWASMCGPFRWMDITGGPALYARAMKGVLPTLDNSPELPRTLREPPASFYEYEAGEVERWHEELHRNAWSLFKDKK
ncbi:MAG: 3-hydroxyacyl-CoA dehydrogenase family protein [Bryobacterales bacterium]|nr:3-hydroxyacyl-CoA dehydrogenase family protein [Bryobacterales bacterium]